MVSSEAVIQKNPDITLASWCGKKVNIEKIKARTGWERINAVLTNSIFEIKSPVILQPGPGCITDGLFQIVALVERWQKTITYEKSWSKFK